MLRQLNAVLFLMVCSVAVGADAERHPMEGMWRAIWINTENQDMVKGHVAVYQGWEREPTQDEYGALVWGNAINDHTLKIEGITIGEDRKRVTPQESSLGVDGGQIEWAYGHLGHWGGDSTVTLSGEVVTGQWTYGDDRGVEFWRRLQPQITGVKFIPRPSEKEGPAVPILSYGELGAVRMHYDRSYWGPENDMRGTRPSFTIEFYGENLWGNFLIHLNGERDLEPLGAGFILRDGSRIAGYVKDGYYYAPDVVGRYVEVVVWEMASPGRKRLTVEGLNIDFDFLVEGFQEPKSLRFVRYVEGETREIDQLQYGEEFYVEATYASEPPFNYCSVGLNLGGKVDSVVRLYKPRTPRSVGPRLTFSSKGCILKHDGTVVRGEHE